MFASPSPQRASIGAESRVDIYSEHIEKRHDSQQTYTAEKAALLDLQKHPSTSELISFDDEIRTLTMRRAPGVSLREILPAGSYEGVDLQIAHRILRQLATTVQDIHAKGWLHNDLTMDNIFYCAQTDTLTVIDFGRSLKLSSGEHLGNAIYGNIRGGSPEKIAQKLPLSYASDIYSLGNISYEILEGMFPFEDGYNDLAFQIVHSSPAHQERGTIEVQELITQMLAKDPSVRPSIADILKVLPSTW
jgi:serine/threonine protein kinase